MKPIRTLLVKDTQRSYKWKASIMEPGTVKEGGVSGFFKDFLFDSIDDFAGAISSGTREGRVKFHPMLITSVSVPSNDIEMEAIPIKGTQWKRPTSSTISTVTITFVESTDGEIVQALEAWRGLVYNDTTNTFGLPSDYEADILVQLTTSYNVVHTTFKLVKCWPLTTEPLQLSYTESGAVSIGQTFAVSRMIIDQKGLFEVLTDPDIEDLDIAGLSGGLRLGGVF